MAPMQQNLVQSKHSGHGIIILRIKYNMHYEQCTKAPKIVYNKTKRPCIEQTKGTIKPKTTLQRENNKQHTQNTVHYKNECAVFTGKKNVQAGVSSAYGARHRRE
jgi:hypothetical protein